MIYVYQDTMCRTEWGKPIYHQLSDAEVKNYPQDKLGDLLFIRSQDEEDALERDMAMGVDNV